MIRQGYGLEWLRYLKSTDRPDHGRHRYPLRPLSPWKTHRLSRQRIGHQVISKLNELTQQLEAWEKRTS